MKTEAQFKADKAFLRDHALFGGFSDEDLGVVVPLLAEETFAKGEDIVSEGEMGDRLYFIVSGRVEVLKRAGGKNGLITTLQSGDAFGEMEVIDISVSTGETWMFSRDFCSTSPGKSAAACAE